MDLYSSGVAEGDGGVDKLQIVEPSPVVSLNRAVAVAMKDGPQAGLLLIDGLASELNEYHLLHAACGFDEAEWSNAKGCAKLPESAGVGN